MRWLRRNYLSIDPRTLGLLRIALGLLLWVDLIKRWLVLPLFYTNLGLIPNHRVLWNPLHEWMFSPLLALSLRHEVVLAFALIGAIYTCLLFGFRTRTSHVLSLLAVIALQVRVDVLASGADYVLSDLVLWTCWLPLGARFSLDALRQPAAVSNEPVVSAAVLAATLQLCVIYFFNAVHKNGPTWLRGEAVHYLLHQERIVTSLGLWVRQHVSFGQLALLSHATRWVELALPFLILSPWGRPWTRRVAVASIFGLHAGMAALANLGLFSPVMMVFGLLLVTAEDWNAWQTWTARSPRLRGLPGAVSTAATRLLAQLMEASAARAPAEAPLPPMAAEPNRLQRSVAYLRGGLPHVALLILASAALSQVLIENPAVPAFLRLPQPRFLRAVVSYARLNQGWSMFAPDVPTTDAAVVIDAVTVAGRHVDPLNELDARDADPLRRSIAPRLGYSAAFCDYTVGIADQERLHEPLREWIMRYHRRTHHPEDRILNFAAYAIEQDSPKPGEPAPKFVRARMFLSQ